MTGRLVTEVVIVGSLQEFNSQLEAEIDHYLSQKEEYSERLGSFLRDAEEEHSDEDWFKQINLDKLGGGKGKSKSDKKKKGKKSKNAEAWVPFKNLELSTSVQGEAEIMFEAISAITQKLDRLTEARESVEELRKVGLGNDVTYICYLEDGVLSKVVIKPMDESTAEKFTFNRGFTIIKAVQPQV
ncbi:MAG: hypothetical protein JSV18_08395 [Candidatus Bathyarchaeota archaeon]|nr:MAG: hypothetical protein JSV18_08395 [Candidatus Bathyarchaeota archaeon]